MTACLNFRSRFQPATDDAELLAHLRSCDVCLQHAAAVDPDVIFRAIGGEDELVPPGGIDAFVDDVMQQVRVRDAEITLTRRPSVAQQPWTRRFAIAATIAAAVTGGTLVWQLERGAAPIAQQQLARTAPVAAVLQQNLTTKPVVETYDSETATIVEVPSDSANVQVVMIFDESLPADL